jgi:hypothetical protein
VVVCDVRRTREPHGMLVETDCGLTGEKESGWLHVAKTSEHKVVFSHTCFCSLQLFIAFMKTPLRTFVVKLLWPKCTGHGSESISDLIDVQISLFII